MRDTWRRIVSMLCVGGALLTALPGPAGAAGGKLNVRGGGELPLGAEHALEIDLGSRSFRGKKTVTVSGYLDLPPEDYVSDGLVLRLDGLEGGTEAGWADLAHPGETLDLDGGAYFEDGALVLGGTLDLPKAAAKAVGGGTYTVEYFLDAEGYSGGENGPAPLLTSSGSKTGWGLRVRGSGETAALTPGNGGKLAEAAAGEALGGPCAVAVQAGSKGHGGWYRDGRPLVSFDPPGKTGTADLTLGGGEGALRVYSLRIYDRALSQEELRANAALDRSRFRGEEEARVPDLTVNGLPLDPDGETAVTLEFEKGTARLPIRGGALGELTLTLAVGDKTGTVELSTVSALDRALELAPGSVNVTVGTKATALEVRTAVAKKVEEAIAESGFTQAGGVVRVMGEEKKTCELRFTGEGRTETRPLKISVYRREPKGEEALRRLLLRVQKGTFAFEEAGDVTAEAIAAQAARTPGAEDAEFSARWSEEDGCWYLKAQRSGDWAEVPLWINTRAELTFDDPALLDACAVRLVGGDDAYIAGGALHVTGTAGNTYEAVVLPVWNFGRDFAVEAEVRLTGAASDSRWFGLAFGVRPNPSGRADQFSFWQLALRRDTAADNGAQLSRMLPGGAWSPGRSGPLAQALEPGRTYRLTIRYEAGVVCQYVDGELVLRLPVPDPKSVDGKLAFTFDGATAELLSLKVTDELPDLPTEQAMADNGFDARVYEPKTGLVMSPTIVSEGGTASAAAGAGRRSATLARPLGSDLTVDDGGSRVTIAEFLRRLDRKCLAGFRIGDEATAAAFGAYADAHGLTDVTVFSASPAVLRAACGGRTGVRAVLDVSASMPRNLADAVQAANRAGARALVLPQSAADREAVRYIQTRAVAVWVRPAPDELYEAILSGCDGLVVEDGEAALDAVESFPTDRRVLTRTPIVTAHRGLHETAPENTERAAVLAVQAGAEAIECDVHLTLDGQVVVSHDGTTGAQADRDIYISQSTLAQLQGLSLKWNSQPGDRIPTLAQLFQAVDGVDPQGKTVFYVEIKSPDERLIPVLAQAVRDAGMADRVVFLSYDEEQLARIRAQMPECSAGVLSALTRSGQDGATNLRALAGRLDPISAFYSCPQEAQSQELVQAARHRGLLLHPWTVDEYELFEQKYYEGCHGFTTDRADYAAYYLDHAEPEQTSAVTRAGEDGAMFLRVRQYFREGSAAALAETFFQISGDAEVQMDGEGRFWSAEPGTARVLLGVRFTLPATQVPYLVYTAPVTLTFR